MEETEKSVTLAQNGEKGLRRSNRQSTSNLKSVSALSKEKTEKGYTLDRTKALVKKAESCSKEHLSYTLKPGKNFVMECSTATYELSKGVIRSILETKDIFKTEYSVKTEEGVDQTGAHVESRYKLFQRKKGGEPGCYSKLTINMYNTTSRILVNGARLDLFMNNIFTDLKEEVEKNHNHVKIIDNSLRESINANLGIKGNNSDRPSLTNSDSEDNSSEKKTENEQVMQNECEPNEQLNEPDDYIECPVCDEGALTEVIQCEECQMWFHFVCVGLNGKDANKIPSSCPFICNGCNDNELYSEERECSSGTTEIDPQSEIDKQTGSSLGPSAGEVEKGNVTVSCENTSVRDSGSGAVGKTNTVKYIEKSAYCRQNTPSRSDCSIDSQDLPSVKVTNNSNKNNKQDNEKGDNKSQQKSMSTKQKPKAEIEQKTLIMQLERQLREKEKTINLLRKVNNGSQPTDIREENDRSSVQCTNCKSAQTQPTNNDIENRLKLMEMNMIQNMNIVSNSSIQQSLQMQSMASQLALQSQNMLLLQQASSFNFVGGNTANLHVPTPFTSGFNYSYIPHRVQYPSFTHGFNPVNPHYFYQGQLYVPQTYFRPTVYPQQPVFQPQQRSYQSNRSTGEGNQVNGQGRGQQRQATTATETIQQPVQQPASRLQEVPMVKEEPSQSGVTHPVHTTTNLHLQQHPGVIQQNIPVTADLIEEDVEIITQTAVPDTVNDSRHADDKVCHREDPSDSQNKTEAQLSANNITKDNLQNSKLQGSPENTILQDSSENHKKSPTVFRIPSLKCNPPDTQELYEMSLNTRL